MAKAAANPGRARKKAAKSTPKKNAERAPILPVAVTQFLRNSSFRSIGAFLILAAVFLGLALGSFNPDDPSFNATSDGAVTNLAKEPGAKIADLLLQTIGLSSALILLPLVLWGIKILRLKWIRRFWLNLIVLPFGIVGISVALAGLEPAVYFPIQSGYGGSVGYLIFSVALENVPTDPIGALWTKRLIALAFAGAGTLMFAFSLAFNRAEWARIGRAIWSVIRFVARQVWAILAGIFGLIVGLFQRSSDEGEEEAPARRIASTDRANPVKAAPKPQASKRVKKAAPPKKGSREKKEQQQTLALPLPTSGFQLPPLGLLTPPPDPKELDRMSEDALEQNARLLEGVLDDFGVQGSIDDVRPGPVVTLYELEPARGTKSARVIGLADDIARSMSAISARVAVVPGRNAIGIELPNQKRQTVFLRELLASKLFEQSKARLPVILGKDIGGEPVVADLAGMPHLLVAGTTGSGKSVGINTMILSLLFRHGPENLRLIMVDPKMLELSIYDDIPHLLTPVVTEPKKAVVALKWAVREMEERYRNMSKLGVRNLAAFNKRVEEARAKGEQLSRQVQAGFDRETGEPIVEEQIFDFEPLPYLVIVIDEMADLMLVAGKDVEATVQRLAQMARAAGIHLIMATQRPSVDVITGTIKANFPTRISFQVTSKIDSRTILGEQGAEQLLGMGDMLYMAGGGRITRVHGAFVSDKEVEDVVNHLKKQGAPDYKQEVTEEPEEGFDSPFIPGPSGGSAEDTANSLYDQAVNIVLRDRRASTSYIQRRLKIGYNKAASLIEDMEQQGVISAPNHKGQREVLVPEREDDV